MKDTALHSARRYNITTVLLLTAGILLRLFHFINHRSLWEDEFYLSSSFLHMDLHQLATLPLDYQQRAPLGYLFAERLCVYLFGMGEMALRLFPFLCSLASVIVFVPVARHFLRPLGAVIATAILCLAPTFVYHAVEAKQYSTELLATILSLWLYVRSYRQQQPLQPLPLALWGVCGAIIIWFSFTSMFVLAGIGAAICLQAIINKDWKRFTQLLLPTGLWLISFALCYLFFVSRYPDEPWLQYYWQNRDAFMPIGGSLVFWLTKQTYSVLHNPLGLTWVELDYHYTAGQKFLARVPYVSITCWLVGIYSFARYRRQMLYVLSFPILITLAASAVKLYPLQERLILFLSPLLLLFIGQGCVWIMDLFKNRRAIRLLLPILLIAPAAAHSGWQVLHTGYFGEYKKSYERETMLYLNAHCGKNDVVYLYWNDLPGYNYYKQAYQLHFPAVTGSDYRNASTSFPDYYRHLQTDFNQFAGRKYVWLVYKNFNGIRIGDFEGNPKWYYALGVNAVENLAQQFATMGRQVAVYYPAGKGRYCDVVVVKYRLYNETYPQ